MPDRVKEAVFDILGAHYGTPGELPPLRVADLFCGGGTMGLEAVSRGAASCVFFENGGEALAALRKNLNALGAGPELSVVRCDIYDGGIRLAKPRGPFDLLFVDPPYADAEDVSPAGRLPRLMRQLARATPPESEAILVLHHPHPVAYSTVDAGAWQVMDERRYGSAGITLFGLPTEHDTREPAHDGGAA